MEYHALFKKVSFTTNQSVPNVTYLTIGFIKAKVVFSQVRKELFYLV
jgi:hypothetical protein